MTGASLSEGRAILLHEADNVATALTDLPANAEIALIPHGPTVRLIQDIRFGHKFAVRPIAAGDDVLKYGVPIGRAFQHIQAGEYVHLHNIMSLQMKGEADEGIQEGGWKNRRT